MSYTESSASDDLVRIVDNINAGLLAARHLNPSSKTATFDVWGDDAAGSPKDLYLCDATSGAITANLEAAATYPGRPVVIMKTDASGNAVTIDGDGSETINGSATVALSSQYDYRIVLSDGSNYFVIGSS